MKISNLTTKTLLFNDLGSFIKGVSPILRSVRLDPIGTAGATKYLLETSEVLLSWQAGDIHRFLANSAISVNDTLTALGAGASATIAHGLGVMPNVTVVKIVGGVPIQCSVGTTGPLPLGSDVEITHNAAFTETYIKNLTAGALDFVVRLS